MNHHGREFERQHQLLAVTMKQHWSMVVMTIEWITYNRVTTVRQVHPNLMCAASEQLQLYKTHFLGGR